MSISKLIQKPLSAIKSVKFKYKDNLNYKNISFSTSEGIDFTLCKALDNFNDYSINNYSGFFIGKKTQNSDWLNFKNKTSNALSLLSTIKFVDGTNFAYLKFDRSSTRPTPKYSGIWDAGLIIESDKIVRRLGLKDDDLKHSKDHLFFIDFIEGTTKCYIKHNDRNKEYYLYNRRFIEANNENEIILTDDLWFTTNKKYYEKFGQFDYIIEGNSLILYITEKNSIKISDNTGKDIWVDSEFNLEKLSENSLGNSERINIIVPTEFPEKYIYNVDLTKIQSIIENDIKEVVRVRTLNFTDNYQVKLVDNKSINITNNNCVSIIYNSENNINNSNFIDSSWISYKNKDLSEINITRSGLNLDSQCLFHWQYNNVDKNYETTLDIIPLKNHISPQNNVIRGDYMTNIDMDIPNVDFREYTTIETGTNQEFGTDNITLVYTYYNKEYTVKPGNDLAFTIKDNKAIANDNGMENILYPYYYLNINDTNFIKNGACGSSIPFLADKVKKLQSNSKFANNGRYLYTWLYQNKTNPYGVWLDRYYYPDRITKYDVIKNIANIKDGSFEDIIDKDYINNPEVPEESLNLSDKISYFDKTSDLMFEPNTNYVYSRIGKHNIDTILDEIKDNSLTDKKIFESGNDIIKFNSDKLKENGILDFNFDMYIKAGKYYGFDIISNSAANGFSIKNRTDISPFIYTFDNTNLTISLHNYNFIKIKDVNLYNLFEDTTEIKKLVIGKPFDNIVVITNNSILVFDFDLKIKDRYFINSTIINSIINLEINENNLYIIYNDNNRYHRIINFNLVDGTYNECLNYAADSILVRKNAKVYPFYRSLLENGRVIDTTNILPVGINVGDKVVIVKDSEYTSDYWYISPVFQDTNEVQHNSCNINSLTIRDNDIICLPYYAYCYSLDNILYGLRERSKDSLYQFEAIDIDEYKNSSTNSVKDHILYMSYTKLCGVSSDKLGRFALIKKNNDILSLYIFDKTKKLIKNIPLGNTYNELFNLDAFNAYINGNIETYFGLIGTIKDNITNEIAYHFITVDDEYSIQDTELNYNISDNVKLCNYSEILNTKYNNSLQFILNLQKDNTLSDKFIYSLNLDDINDGWHNFRVIIDLNKGKFEVYRNDNLLSIEKEINISPHIYNIKNTFNYPITIGNTMYNNDISLGTFLKLEDDTFNTVNLRLKNITAYAKTLRDYQEQALILSKSNINPLTFTLPCGQKNNLEEIIRFFKFNPPGNMSNVIDINIKNANMINEESKENLIQQIKENISNNIGLPLTINKINFI